MKVCVNVDDFGYSYGQVDGTIYAYKHGVVTSTTALCTQRDDVLVYAAKKAEEVPGLGVGVHLNLTYGKPLTAGKTICDSSGMFFDRRIINYEAMDQQEIYEEFKAQVERFLHIFGKRPTHLDSHHKTYSLMEDNDMKGIVKRVADEYGLECRGTSKRLVYMTNPPHPLLKGYNLENFEIIVKDALEKGHEGIEIYSHPAFVDEELFTSSSYRHSRVKELEFLCSDELKEFYKKYQLEKVHF